jgi:hypothetical protein
MKITDVPLAVLRFQYQIARFPLSLIEQQVAARMDSEAPVRLLYERSLGMLDSTVGNALGASELKQRGAALIERSDALRRASQLEATATQNIKQADSELKNTRKKAVGQQKQAHAEKQREVTEAREDAQDRKRAAVDTAEKRISARKRQADEVAAQRKNVVEEVKQNEQDKIRAAEQSAAMAADAQLKDAQQKHNVAATERAQADRMETLADAEKQRRQTNSSTTGDADSS